MSETVRAAAFQPLEDRAPGSDDRSMTDHQGSLVTVVGAYGHTGRFVVAELRRRGLLPVLSGRDPQRLAALAESYPGLETRPATVEDPGSLDRALAGVAAVI